MVQLLWLFLTVLFGSMSLPAYVGLTFRQHGASPLSVRLVSPWQAANPLLNIDSSGVPLPLLRTLRAQLWATVRGELDLLLYSGCILEQA